LEEVKKVILAEAGMGKTVFVEAEKLKWVFDCIKLVRD
jgi:hypothetical protein